MQTIKNNKAKLKKKHQFKKNQTNSDEPSKPGFISKTYLVKSCIWVQLRNLTLNQFNFKWWRC